MNFQSNSSINSALTVKSLKLKHDFCNRQATPKKFPIPKPLERKEAFKQTIINNHKLEKQILIEKEMINMLFKKNEEKKGGKGAKKDDKKGAKQVKK